MLYLLQPDAPPKKYKTKKKSKGEKAMEKAITAFMKYQSEADERFQKATPFIKQLLLFIAFHSMAVLVCLELSGTGCGCPGPIWGHLEASGAI